MLLGLAIVEVPGTPVHTCSALPTHDHWIAWQLLDHEEQDTCVIMYIGRVRGSGDYGGGDGDDGGVHGYDGGTRAFDDRGWNHFRAIAFEKL